MTLFKRPRYSFQILKSQKISYLVSTSSLFGVRGSRNLCTPNKIPPTASMTETLKQNFPLAKQIEVQDISEGTGYMYEVFVETEEFKGLTMLKQHRLINEALKEHIKKIHSIRIRTSVPT